MARRAENPEVSWEVRTHDFRVVIARNGTTLHYDLAQIEYRMALKWVQEFCEQGDRYYIAIKLPFEDGFELVWLLYDPAAALYPDGPPSAGYSRLVL